jgi:S1-C subfamily serine protease
MSRVKCLAWDLLCLLLGLLVALGIAAKLVYGDDARSAPDESSGAKCPVLLDFYSDSCGPCQAMTPTIDALARAGYTVRRVNVDQNPALVRQYRVQRIPCFVTVVDGQAIDSVVGACSYERLETMLRRPSRGPAPMAPHPAWRYERSVGHRAAVVRIFCEVDARQRSIGSGTLVQWSGRTVVLTAGHVVRDAKQIVVELCTGQTHRARVVKLDKVWDCAVLALVGTPQDVEPARVELGSDAVQREGDRLESCGYGPDGRLACNSGLFLGYRRSTEAPRGPDDWLVVSGHARGGDSGGPIFNGRGRLVGVLWGTDGREVVGVQAGRIHALLDDAFATYQQKAVLERSPTPPRLGSLVTVPSCESGCVCPAGQTSLGKKPVLPWRGGAEARDRSQAEQIDKLIELERLRAERQGQQDAARSPSPQPPVTSFEAEPSPLLAALCILAGVAVGFVVYFTTQKSNH